MPTLLSPDPAEVAEQLNALDKEGLTELLQEHLSREAELIIENWLIKEDLGHIIMRCFELHSKEDVLDAVFPHTTG